MGLGGHSLVPVCEEEHINQCDKPVVFQDAKTLSHHFHVNFSNFGNLPCRGHAINVTAYPIDGQVPIKLKGMKGNGTIEKT